MRAINPWFSSCTDLWFDAVDPPRALVTEGGLLPSPPANAGPALKDPNSVLVGPTTSILAPAPSVSPMPGSVLQPGPTPTALPDTTRSGAPTVPASPAQNNIGKSQKNKKANPVTRVVRDKAKVLDTTRATLATMMLRQTRKARLGMATA